MDICQCMQFGIYGYLSQLVSVCSLGSMETCQCMQFGFCFNNRLMRHPWEAEKTVGLSLVCNAADPLKTNKPLIAKYFMI